MNERRMLVLYRELAGYFVHCMKHLATHHGVEIDIVAYPVNAEAPFEFDFGHGIRVFKRSEVNADVLRKMCKERRYSLLFCGGWTDALYLEIVREHRHIPSLVGFDKQWLGSWRDVASALVNRFRVRPLFDYAFVPGSEQAIYARRMGFSADAIVTGAYSAHVEAFSALPALREAKDLEIRKLWYAGRYIAQKDVERLFTIVDQLFAEGLSGWELHAVGTGELFGKIATSSRIVHHGFVQPAQMLNCMSDGDLFVLPSLYEPWGVVVHEFAAAGYPLLLSDKVGARTAFLENGVNGEIFKAGDAQALKEVLKRWMQKPREALHKAGRRSYELAQSITPETYAQSLLKMMK